MRKRLLLGLVCAAVMPGQTLRAPSSSTSRNDPGSFSLLLDSPAGKAPVALQWDFTVPPALAIALPDIKVGSAAESAHKTLTCAVRNAKTPAPNTIKYGCILAGGTEALPNGPVAVVRYRALANVQGAPIRVIVDHVAGVSADLKPIAVGDAEAIIRIQ